jgi:capsule polysaccharide export protein KpsE/RkpR
MAIMANDTLLEKKKRKPKSASKTLVNLAWKTFELFYGLTFLTLFTLLAYTRKSNFRTLSAKEKQDLAAGMHRAIQLDQWLHSDVDS